LPSSVSVSTIAASIQTDPVPATLPELYLDLMKKLLTRAIVARRSERHTLLPRGPKSRLLCKINRLSNRFGLEFVRLVGSSEADYLESGHEASKRVEDAETMLGTRQLDQMQRCIDDVLRKSVPGDVLEAGVWRGGMTIFMRAVLKAYGSADRKVWVVDSFAGLPPIDRDKETFDWQAGNMAVSLDQVQANFARYGLLDDQVLFLKGYFCDTLPDPRIGKLAILRVDADLYSSTVDVLRALYPALSVGGYAIFDDYQNLPDCRRAIDEFRQENGITDELRWIDERAVYWQRSI
jgi:O-methyltransferase